MTIEDFKKDYKKRYKVLKSNLEDITKEYEKQEAQGFKTYANEMKQYCEFLKGQLEEIKMVLLRLDRIK